MPPAGIVAGSPPPVTATLTVRMSPLPVSVTVQIAPAGMPPYVFETVPAFVPAGITQSGSRRALVAVDVRS